jgi:glycosyltransferase involved in cell wall biosynthesis
MLDITVCILSLNRPAYLCEAVDSVLAQSKLPKYIYIFDNGSDVGVKETVLHHLASGVRWFGSDKTNSMSRNIERAIPEVKTEFVMFMHDDDRLCSVFLEKQIAFLQENLAVCAVACNSYYIAENGTRNGKVLRPEFINTEAELYSCSADVAKRYASDSCILFPTVVYKTEIVKKIQLRHEFEKVVDPVFLCDIADSGVIAYQSAILYELRIHSEQHSSYFPPDLMYKLGRFFWTRTGNSEEDIVLLRRLLIRQHTSRVILSILDALKPPFSHRKIYNRLLGVKDEMFDTSDAFGLILNGVKKRVIRKIKTFL